jgi:hypothetical protein
MNTQCPSKYKTKLCFCAASLSKIHACLQQKRSATRGREMNITMQFYSPVLVEAIKIFTSLGVGHFDDVRCPCRTSWIISSAFIFAK